MSARFYFVLVLLVIITYNIGILGFQQANDAALSVTPLNYYTETDKHIDIPIMIHLDKALIKRLIVKNKHRLREKFKTAGGIILRDVEKIFKHPSLNVSLSLTLIDVKVLKSKINKIAIDENVSKYLKSYCEWQAEKKTRRGRWWYSILFTGLDLFYMDGFGREVRRSTGRGYMNGMCSRNNSCTLLEWQSKNIAYILAHEIAHSLGVPHDGPPHNECKGRRYIMDALYSPHNPAKAWSPCNKRDLRKFLKSKHAWCLRPEGRNFII